MAPGRTYQPRRIRLRRELLNPPVAHVGDVDEAVVVLGDGAGEVLNGDIVVRDDPSTIEIELPRFTSTSAPRVFLSQLQRRGSVTILWTRQIIHEHSHMDRNE